MYGQGIPNGRQSDAAIWTNQVACFQKSQLGPYIPTEKGADVSGRICRTRIRKAAADYKRRNIKI